mmetsp:Transcript_28323/g.57533  ORF Transcript_28323/g.57533 Transcript_28323/m.57533 type:complete len:257 (+) Transcript_28323:237-1007(+)
MSSEQAGLADRTAISICVIVLILFCFREKLLLLLTGIHRLIKHSPVAFDSKLVSFTILGLYLCMFLIASLKSDWGLSQSETLLFFAPAILTRIILIPCINVTLIGIAAVRFGVYFILEKAIMTMFPATYRQAREMVQLEMARDWAELIEDLIRSLELRLEELVDTGGWGREIALWTEMIAKLKSPEQDDLALARRAKRAKTIIEVLILCLELELRQVLADTGGSGRDTAQLTEKITELKSMQNRMAQVGNLDNGYM